MADRELVERLQPSLLDRLTDDEPESRVEPRRARVIDVDRLREILRRDLAWLLNTAALGDEIDPARHPRAARSVLNYGVREVTGAFDTEARAERLRVSIREAVERFEPRIAPGSLEVRLRGDDARGRMVVAFDIVADMWAQPMPLELFLRSEVDLGTGELTLERAG